MIKTFVLCSALVAATVAAQSPAPAQVPPMPRDQKIALVDSDLHAISRIAALARDLGDVRQVLQTMVDSDIELLREKRPDDTYRWAALQREEAGRAKEESGVERVQSEKELRQISVSAPNAYRVEIIVPTKRNLVSGNNRVFVRDVLVDSTGFDGKTNHQEIPVNTWVTPGDSYGVALPEIGKSVKATAEVGVESGDKKAVAQVALVQAKLVDDPASPYYPAVKRLLQVRQVVGERNIDRGLLKSTADEAVLALPGELEKRTAEQTAAAERRKQLALSGQTGNAIALGDATPDVVASLQEIARLLGGTLQDQTDARTRLQTLIDTLQPPKPVTPPVTSTSKQ